MRVLIVDDEIIIREWFELNIKKIDVDIELVLTAKNGKEAMDLISKNNINIVITDIKMPVANGFELLDFINKRKDIYVIIISSFSEFDYAVKAFKKGAFDFILKPEVTKDRLTILFEDIKEDMSKNDIYNDFNKEEILLIESNKILKSLYYKNEPLIDVISKKSYGIIIGYSNEIKFELWENYHVLNGEIKICCLKENTYLLIFEKDSDMSALYFGKQIFNTIKLQLINKRDILISGVFVGKIVDKKLYKFINILETNIFYENTNLIENIESNTYKNIINEIIKNSSDKERVTSKDINKLKTEINNINNIPIKELKYSSIRFISLLELKFTESNSLLDGIDSSKVIDMLKALENVNNFNEYKILMNSILDSFEDTIKNSNNYSESILLAIKYINENYSNNISLDEISHIAGLNRSYFSDLFKKETGNNYSSYLTLTRINKAKEKIIKSNDKINNIAFEVGFNNPAYFSKVFRQITDVTPQEYREIQGVIIK